jgi:hypothetical protein
MMSTSDHQVNKVFKKIKINLFRCERDKKKPVFGGSVPVLWTLYTIPKTTAVYQEPVL